MYIVTHPAAVSGFCTLSLEDGTLRGDGKQPTVFASRFEAFAAIMDTLREFAFNPCDFAIVDYAAYVGGRKAKMLNYKDLAQWTAAAAVKPAQTADCKALKAALADMYAALSHIQAQLVNPATKELDWCRVDAARQAAEKLLR